MLRVNITGNGEKDEELFKMFHSYMFCIHLSLIVKYLLLASLTVLVTTYAMDDECSLTTPPVLLYRYSLSQLINPT